MSVLITSLYGLAALLAAALGIVELRMLARFLKHRSAIQGGATRRRNGTSPGDGEVAPTVTIQIPLYNERTSAEQIVRAAAAQDYPRDRFDIQVLDDSTDETSAIVATVSEEVRRSGVAIDHLRRDERVGYKAGALAEGLERSSSEFVAVFDADFVPETGFLSTVLREERPFSDPHVAFAQARWAWEAGQRRDWLSRVLSLLLDRHFRIQKPTRAHVGNVTTFNGSGGIWRRAAIDDAGGWTSDTLTEDLDLSYRCALAGWHGRYLHDVRVVNELPGHMRAFKLQQRRWAQGTAQCMRKLARRLLGAPERVEERWEEIFLLAGYAIHPILLLCVLLWPWAVLTMDRTVFLVMQAFMGLGISAAGLSLLLTVRERDGRLGLGGIHEIVAGLCLGSGLMVNNTVGQVQGFFARGGEFVRTPKGRRVAAGTIANGSPSPKPYTAPLHWSFFGEVALLAYCAASAVLLIRSGEALWSIALIFWAVCLGLVIQQQLSSR